MKYTSNNSGSGIICKDVTIEDVQDLSGQVHEKILKPFELMFELQVNDGKFTSKFTIFGNFKRKEDGTFDNFGATFKIGELFTSAGLQMELDDATMKVLPELTAQLKGKKISLLKYIGAAKLKDGVYKPTWYTWDITMPAGKNDTHRARFLKGVADGKIKDFNPKAVEEAGSDFNPETLSA